MEEKREYKLDLIRTIAILLICFNHAISTFYVDQVNFELFNKIGLTSQAFMVTSYIFSRIGVPLFLFLTGALILNKNFKTTNDIKKFYKKNILSLFICVEIWNIIYYFVNQFITKSNFNVIDLLQILTFTKKSVYGHMWYMPMILGMYLFLPFISIIVKRFKLRDFLLPIILTIIHSFLFIYIKYILIIEKVDLKITSLLDLSFSGAQYGIYIIIGYYIYRKDVFKKIKPWILTTISIVSFIICCLFQVYLSKKEASAIVYYNFVGILIMSICVYLLLLKLEIKESKLLKYVSTNSLPIYFVHFPILVILNEYINLHLSRPISVIIYYFASLLISIIIIEILKRINIIKKYLLRQ